MTQPNTIPYAQALLMEDEELIALAEAQMTGDESWNETTWRRAMTALESHRINGHPLISDED